MLRDISENNGLILNHTKNKSLLNKEVDIIKQNIENQTLLKKTSTSTKNTLYPFGKVLLI